MLPTVGVSSTIPHPHIVTSIGKDEGESLFRTCHYKVRGGAQESVLDVDWGTLSFLTVDCLSVGNPVQGQVVAVTGYQLMILGGVAIVAD